MTLLHRDSSRRSRSRRARRGVYAGVAAPLFATTVLAHGVPADGSSHWLHGISRIVPLVTLPRDPACARAGCGAGDTPDPRNAASNDHFAP